jgi:glutathione S-transferase
MEEHPSKKAKTASEESEYSSWVGVPTVPTIDSKPDKTTLVYWDIRGLAQACRLALEYTQQGDYVDVRIDAGSPSGPHYKQSWFTIKPEIGMTFANLPYLIDGEGVAIPQSSAILRHVCRKHGLIPDSLAAAARGDAVLDQLCDFDSGLTRMCYGNYNAGKDSWVTTQMVPNLEKFNAVLAKEDKPWFSGDGIGAADFKAYEEFDKCRIIAPEACADWATALPALDAFMKRFEALPTIAAYLSSDRFMARPLNNPHAEFK